MPASKKFSIYSAGAGHIDHPLRDLVGEEDKGWHVARNLLKPLNHLDRLKRKEEIAAQLNLHNILSPPEQFNTNYRMLEEHQNGKLTTARFLEHLSSQLKVSGHLISAGEISMLLQEYATVAHMEFHPSDVCNLACMRCTYGHDDPNTKPQSLNYPFTDIGNLAQLKPRSMVFVGGGEPTLYRYGGIHFQELVEEVSGQNPKTVLALITNGTFKPPGNWPDRFSWIRLSLDAATEKTYQRFRGKPAFNQVIRNFLSYLDCDIPYVGIGFLFSRSNIQEYAAVSAFIYNLVKKEKPGRLHKVNIQYRPMRRDPNGGAKPFEDAITEQQIRTTVKEITELAESSMEMKAFLKEQTNITAVLGGNLHAQHDFSRCYYSQMFKIIRANGDLRPCFIRVMEPDFILGNLLRDSMETIALNTIYIGARRKPHCNANDCRQCHVNYVFEQGLTGKIQPVNSPEVLADPMF